MSKTTETQQSFVSIAQEWFSINWGKNQSYTASRTSLVTQDWLTNNIINVRSGQWYFPYHNTTALVTPVEFPDKMNVRYDTSYVKYFTDSLEPKGRSSKSFLLQYMQQGSVGFAELATIVASQETLRSHSVNWDSTSPISLPLWFQGQLLFHTDKAEFFKVMTIANGRITETYTDNSTDGFQGCDNCRMALASTECHIFR